MVPGVEMFCYRFVVPVISNIPHMLANSDPEGSFCLSYVLSPTLGTFNAIDHILRLATHIFGSAISLFSDFAFDVSLKVLF